MAMTAPKATGQGLKNLVSVPLFNKFEEVLISIRIDSTPDIIYLQGSKQYGKTLAHSEKMLTGYLGYLDLPVTRSQ